jgi:SAM-dependent methyltransferase
VKLLEDVMTATTPPDLNSKMTERARTVWSLGDFARAGAEQVIVGELLARAIDIHPGQRVLDVAAGSGNAALAAARRGARVTATDFVPQLLQTAARRAGTEGLELETREADAQSLPFADGTFDVVLSTFGVMFAPDQSRAAAELLRVCRPGGRIGLISWTPAGFIGQMFATMKPYVAPPPPGAQPPPLWGDLGHVRELFGDRVSEVEASQQLLEVDRLADPVAFLEYFKSHYGPTIAAYRGLADDPARTAELDQALIELAERFRTADGRMQWEYLLVVATVA